MQSSTEGIEEAVIGWLAQRKSIDVATIRAADLVEKRIVDSMQFLDFVYFLGELCGQDVTSEITMGDLRSVARITEFVSRKRAETGAPSMAS